MGVDRILQLKLVTDVGNISSAMGTVEGKVGRVRGAFAGLRGFAGPVVIDAALTGLGMLSDALSTGMSDVRAYDDAVFGLGQTLGDSFSSAEVQRIAGDLTAVGTALGFGDDAALVRGLEDATRKLGDVATAQWAVQRAMDVSRQTGLDFDASLDLVEKGTLGLSRSMRDLGISGDTAEERMAAIDATFGGAAETFAGTAEGARQVADAMAGDVWETIGGAINDLVDAALPAMMDIWTQWQPVLLELGAQVGPVFDKVAEAVRVVLDLFAALAPHLSNAWALMSPVVELIGEHVGNTFDGIIEIIGALTDILEGGDIGAAFRRAFSGIVNIVKTPINLMLGAVESGLNWLGDMFMGALEAIRSNLNNVAFVGDHVPDDPITWGGIHVPRLAAGGIVTSPTLALIGEAGPEAVVPLGRGGMGGTVVNIYGPVGDPAALGRAVVEAIQAYEARNGSRWRS